jgi:hypothetical protein
VAPKVKPKTLIVLVDIPKNADPFGDNMWFDVALRLAYPGNVVSGLYFYAGGTPSPGSNLVFRSGKWELTNNGFPTLLSGAGVSQTLFIQYDENGCAKLRDAVPSFLRQNNSNQVYAPSSLIEKGSPSLRAARRYGETNSLLTERCGMASISYAE